MNNLGGVLKIFGAKSIGGKKSNWPLKSFQWQNRFTYFAIENFLVAKL